MHSLGNGRLQHQPLHRRVASWSRRLWHGLLAVVFTPFSPVGRVSQARAAVAVATALLQAVYLPLGPVYVPRGNSATRWFNIVVDVVYALDFVVACNTAVVVRGHELETSRRRILARRMRSGAFFVDLAASLPLDFMLHDAQIEPRANGGGGHPQEEEATLVAWSLVGESLTPTRFVRWVTLLRVLWLARVVRATTQWTYPRRRWQLIAVRVVLLLVLVDALRRVRLALAPTREHHEQEPAPSQDLAVWRRYVADLHVAVPLLLSQAMPPPSSLSSAAVDLWRRRGTAR
ncbi:hypothetical protein PINS_up023271, partial [Pythium insidiosum]